ncbi:MAG: hypothetical protein OXI80_01920, partial [Caldilineaceae bacterium]|nr:hypothetical protein [Caldilineaceae bacterium]
AANAEKRQLATNVCGTFAISHSIIFCHAASPPEFCAHWLGDSAILPTSLYLGRQPELRLKEKQANDVVIHCELLSNDEHRWNRKEGFLGWVQRSGHKIGGKGTSRRIRLTLMGDGRSVGTV